MGLQKHDPFSIVLARWSGAAGNEAEFESGSADASLLVSYPSRFCMCSLQSMAMQGEQWECWKDKCFQLSSGRVWGSWSQVPLGAV